MAIYVVYRKTSETETEVEYRYGGGSDNLDQRLVIDKANPKAPPRVGRFDPIAQKVIGKALATMEETGSWPTEDAIRS